MVGRSIFAIKYGNIGLPDLVRTRIDYIVAIHVQSQQESSHPLFDSSIFTLAKMRLRSLLSAAILAPIAGLAAPASDLPLLGRGEDLCNQYKSPPQLCTPNASVTVAETAQRAYNFYKAFVLDGDARTMFSLIDNSYIVCFTLQDRYARSAKPSIATSSRIFEWSTSYLVNILQWAASRKRFEFCLVL